MAGKVKRAWNSSLRAPSTQRALNTFSRMPSFGPTAKLSSASRNALAQINAPNQKNVTAQQEAAMQRAQMGLSMAATGLRASSLVFGGLPSATLRYVSPQTYSLLRSTGAAEQIAAGRQAITDDANKDLYTLSWWEKLGIARSPEEKAVQESLSNQAYYDSQTQEIRREYESLHETQIVSQQTGIPYSQASQDEGGFFDGLSKSAPWLAVGLIAILALSARR